MYAGEQQCHYMSPRPGILKIPRKMLSDVKLKRAKEEEYWIYVALRFSEIITGPELLPL